MVDWCRPACGMPRLTMLRPRAMMILRRNHGLYIRTVSIFFSKLINFSYLFNFIGNNLYGWAMSQYMPYGGFNWVEPTLNGLNDLDDTSPIGRIYEVDVSYPKELHDKHNDLPFLPQNSIPRGSKVRKLMATFEKKENYVIHYRNLQQAIKNGLIVEKVNIYFI